MSEEPLKRCPKCGKKVRRLIGGGLGIIFKGSGFYVTDNKRSGNGAADHSPNKASSDNGTNGGPSESKSGTDTSKSSESKSVEKSSKSKDSGKAVKDSA